MKPFKFKLQAVLTLRLRAEQQALENYARGIQARQRAADQVTEAEAELCEARRSWLVAMAEGCPAVRAVQMLRYCHAVEERKQAADQALHLAEVELDQVSRRMIHARQQREVVEQYLETQRERYERDLASEERKILDDLVRRPGLQALNPGPVDNTVWN